MTERDMFVEEMQRHIRALGASSVRLTLMSISAPGLPAPVLESAVRTAAAPYDEIGPLGDGSLGLLSLQSAGAEGAAGLQTRFALRVQTILAPMARRRNIGTVHFRAVHRLACELNDASDLFNSLFDTPSSVLSLPVPSARPPLPPFHAAALRFPWYTPLPRLLARNHRT